MEILNPDIVMVAESLQLYNTVRAFDCVYGWKTSGGPFGHDYSDHGDTALMNADSCDTGEKRIREGIKEKQAGL